MDLADVAGHVMRAWATGEADPERTGAPGSPRPAPMAGDDPVATWRAARAASVPTLTSEALGRTTSITGIGDVPLVGMLPLLITDTVTHTWDVGHAVGIAVEIDPVLVGVAFDGGRQHVVRRSQL